MLDQIVEMKIKARDLAMITGMVGEEMMRVYEHLKVAEGHAVRCGAQISEQHQAARKE